MKQLKMIIIKSSTYHEEDCDEHGVHGDVPVKEQATKLDSSYYEHAKNALMSAEGFVEYTKKYGYHFTDALAEYASKMMKNANAQEHSWTALQVKKSMENLGLSIPDNVTLGDVTYLANMYYADLYPDPLKDEASCLRAAYKIANDLDGYEGMTFCRWISDVIGKAIHINWKKFM